MEKYRGKLFNPEVWEGYQKTLPSTKENALVKSAIFENVNKYNAKLGEQAGGFYIVEPIKGRIGGTPVNYDGQTDITSNERDTFYQGKIAYGRANAWGEYDFASSITGNNFKAEAGEVKEYWDEQRQETALSILKGIFSMTGGVNGQFVEKHTLNVNGNLEADSCNRAAQKALGDKKKNLNVMFMHSAVSTQLEGLNLINFLKYTDENGIEKELQIGQYNGKLVVVDDDMPVEDVYEKTADTELVAGKTYYTKSGNKYTAVAEPSASALNTYYEKHVEYTTYLMANKFFEFEPLNVLVPAEIDRQAKEKGGHTDLISRIREIIVPKLLSYKTRTAVSPTNADLSTGANWELVNNGAESNTVYVDDKLIPVVRIISRA